MILEKLRRFIEEANASNSTNEKIEVIRKYPELRELFVQVYSPYIRFNATSENVLKYRETLVEIDGHSTYRDIFDLLEALSSRAITGNTALYEVICFINEFHEYETEILLIIDKNLKTRTDVKLINKVFPDLIPSFNVALANKYDDYESKIDFEKDRWFASHKLDGCRCIAVPGNNGYRFFSRTGNEFFTLDKVKEDLDVLDWSVVFDGEICIVDENGNEDFQSVMKEIRKKDHTIHNPRYKIFDILSPKAFESGKSNDILSKRLVELPNVNGLPTIDILEQIPVKSKEHLTEMMAQATEKGWEGLIIRKDVPYVGKRSNDLLKVKKMFDAEYVVISTESGTFRKISKETGLEVEEIMLSRVNIEHKGNIVGVGSGFSIEQREYYHSHPEEIIGKTICVQYFEETKNQDGNISLRFPVVKHIYENGRDT